MAVSPFHGEEKLSHKKVKECCPSIHTMEGDTEAQEGEEGSPRANTCVMDPGCKPKQLDLGA